MLALTLGAGGTASAQPPDPSIELVVEGGTPLRVALDQRTIVKRVGQLVAATLVEPVSAYDRVVLPAGTKVIGHVESIQSAGKRARALGIMRGDFTPPRRVLLQFDRLIMNDGTELAVQTAAAQGAEYVVRRVAGDNGKRSAASRTRRAIEEQAKEAATVVTAPHKKERFKDASIRALPYHPVFLARGTTYSAKLLSTLSFGSATPAPRAAAGAIPAPDSVLRARLETSVASDTSPRGTPVTARVTQPVLSPDGSLVLPAGTLLTGQVTFSRAARRFRRNGQLRFLFESVQMPDGLERDLMASLHAVESSQGDQVRVDEEGGASVANSKARFAAPALAALAVVGSAHGRLDFDTDGAGPEMQYGGAGSSVVGGFLGLGLFGIALNQLGNGVTLVTASIGLARTVYSTVFARGREISFPVDTAIEIQLAPGPPKPRQR